MHLGNTAHRELTRSVKLAREISGLTFGVYIGELAQGRDSAIARHAELAAAESAVLIAVDPDARTIDIVTGIEAHIFLDDPHAILPRWHLPPVQLPVTSWVGCVRHLSSWQNMHAPPRSTTSTNRSKRVSCISLALFTCPLFEHAMPALHRRAPQ